MSDTKSKEIYPDNYFHDVIIVVYLINGFKLPSRITYIRYGIQKYNITL